MFKLPMSVESLTPQDVQAINKWVNANNFSSIIVLIVLLASCVVAAYISYQYRSSNALWVALFTLAGAGLIGSSLLFYSHTGKTLQEKKKRVLLVTITEKMKTRERAFRDEQKHTDVYALHFGSERLLISQDEWDTYQVGDKIKFHIFLDQDLYFRKEKIQN
jgi:hypothetical protein